MARLMTHAEYLKSDVWKCGESPTKAHHWIGVMEDGKNAILFYCKYCKDVRKFPTTLTEAINILSRGKMSPIIAKVPSSYISHYKKRRGK